MTGSAAQIGGPPVVAYWLGAAGGKKAVVRANMVLFFAGITLLQIVSYGWSGVITREAVIAAVLTGPGYGLGLYVGSRMFGLADEAVFRRASLILIALALVGSLPVWA
jgi:uncharacterized protein